MARLGMDTTQITNDGTQMKGVGSNDIPSLISAVESIIEQMHANWHGADSEAFVNAWNSSYKPNLNTIASDLVNHGTLAVTNASEQDAASAAGATDL